MAARDIMPWTSPFGGHPRMQWFRMNAGEVFFEGEPVSVNQDGELTESLAAGPVDSDLLGIAAGGPGATNINPATGITYATGDLIPVFMPDIGNYFITRNWTAGTAFNDVAPAVADIGDQVGLVNIGGLWGIDQGQDQNEGLCTVIDILDENKNSIQQTGATVSTADGNRLDAPAYFVVFSMGSTQLRVAGEVNAPIA